MALSRAHRKTIMTHVVPACYLCAKEAISQTVATTQGPKTHRLRRWGDSCIGVHAAQSQSSDSSALPRLILLGLHSTEPTVPPQPASLPDAAAALLYSLRNPFLLLLSTTSDVSNLSFSRDLDTLKPPVQALETWGHGRCPLRLLDPESRRMGQGGWVFLIQCPDVNKVNCITESQVPPLQPRHKLKSDFLAATRPTLLSLGF